VIDEYLAAIEGGRSPAVDVRRLSLDERVGDALFMGLRLSDGVDLGQIRARYGVDVWARYGSDLKEFLDAGCLELGAGRLRLTRRGMLLANEVMAVFV